MPPDEPKTRATTAKLTPGEDTISRSRLRTVGDKIWLDWSICLLDGQTVRHRTKGRSAGEVRRRARETAGKLLKSPAVVGRWSPSSRLDEYVDQVVRPIITRAQLADSTADAYDRALSRLVQTCSQHGDEHNLGRTAIVTAMTPNSLETWLAQVKTSHGVSAARAGHIVLSGYIVRSLLRDQLLAVDPMPLLITNPAQQVVAQPIEDPLPLPTSDQWLACIDWLLRARPELYLDGPDRRWTRQQRLATIQGWFDLTALQAATGLRISEALVLKWDDVDFNHTPASASDRLGGQTLVRVSSDRSKTHRGRWAPVLHPDVVTRLKTLADESASDLVFPTATGTARGRQNTINRIKPVYVDLSEAVGAPALAAGHTHLWRSILNNAVLRSADPVIRAAFFGHSTDVNRRYYTDTTDVMPLVEAAQAFLHDNYDD